MSKRDGRIRLNYSGGGEETDCYRILRMRLKRAVEWDARGNPCQTGSRSSRPRIPQELDEAAD